MNLINTITQVLSVQFYVEFSVYYIVCLSPKVISSSITMYLTPFTLYCPPFLPLIANIMLSISEVLIVEQSILIYFISVVSVMMSSLLFLIFVLWAFFVIYSRQRFVNFFTLYKTTSVLFMFAFFSIFGYVHYCSNLCYFFLMLI